MVLYRKGDDQFELEHAALLQGNEYKYPRTVTHVLSKPDVTLQQNKHIAPHHVPATPAQPEEKYKDDFGNPIAITHSPGYLTEDFPVSGSDIAKLRRKKDK